MRCTVHGKVSVEPTVYRATVRENVSVVCTSTLTEPTVLIWLNRSSTEPRSKYITNIADGTILKGLQNKYKVTKLGENESKLTIIDAQLTDAGEYTCKESWSNQITANMRLTVTGKVCDLLIHIKKGSPVQSRDPESCMIRGSRPLVGVRILGFWY